MAPSQAYPATLTGAGLPVPIPDGRGPGRERVVVSPTPALAPPQAVPFLWGTSRQIVGLCGGGLSCAHLTNPSLTRHSSGTWPRQGHPPSSPRYSTVLSRPFVVEARFSARSLLVGRRSGTVGKRRHCRSFRRGTDRHRSHGRACGALCAQRQNHGARQPDLVLGKLAEACVLNLVDARVSQIVVVDHER
jgi:hypothetical protein